jgi:FG-GAP-like repeat
LNKLKIHNRLVFTVMLVLAAMAVLRASAQAQQYSVQTYIVDPNPGIDSLEKAVGYFTSTKTPSIIVGFGTFKGTGGLYLYSSTSGQLAGPWKRTVITPTGNFYEHASPFLYPGNTYPDVVASHDGEITWFVNPANQGNDPTTATWSRITINPGPAWCHDMDIADLNEDGLPDVACSASSLEGSAAFASIESSSNDWQTIEPYPIGDGIGLVSVKGSQRINVVGATAEGVNWYKNPAIVDGNLLTETWEPFSVDGGDDSPNVNKTMIGVVPDYNGQDDAIVVASGEATWTPGLEWWGPQSDPTLPWTAHPIDSSYRAVHAVNGGVFNGVPYFIVGEQEQAGGTSQIPATHPGIPSRVTMFTYNGSTFVPALQLSNRGTHNQAVMPYKGGLLVVGANHGLYGGYPPLQAWYITSGSATPIPTGSPTPTPTATPTPTGSPTPTPTGSPTPTPTGSPTPTPTATPTPTSAGIQFDGRTQNNTNATDASVTVMTPSGVQNGDYLLVTVDSVNPRRQGRIPHWKVLSRTNNRILSYGKYDHIALIYRIWHTGDPTSYSLGNGQLGYPKAVLRAYHGVGAIDAFACSPLKGAPTAGPSFTLAMLRATKSAGEEFIGEWAAASTSSLINGPSDLGDGKADKTQWTTFDGDKKISAAGTVPTAETANIASGSVDWIGCDVTLKHGTLKQ